MVSFLKKFTEKKIISQLKKKIRKGFFTIEKKKYKFERDLMDFLDGSQSCA